MLNSSLQCGSGAHIQPQEHINPSEKSNDAKIKNLMTNTSAENHLKIYDYTQVGVHFSSM